MLKLFISGVHRLVFGGMVDNTFEVFGYVNLHVNVGIFFVVIPVNSQSTIVLIFKVHGDFCNIFKECSRDHQRRHRKTIWHLNPKCRGNFSFVACSKSPVDYFKGT